MKLRKYVAVLLVAGLVNILAADLKQLTVLVEQINKTTDANVKQQLMYDLNKEMENLDPKDLVKAQAIVDEKLK